MKSAKLNPIAQPITGISIWKPPKNAAVNRPALRLFCVIVIPLAIDTAKASIANPTAIKTIVKASTYYTDIAL
ncbi:MAG TPA: hypothetical protein V6C97_21725 [Oculatellaceae cyanobacterium]